MSRRLKHVAMSAMLATFALGFAATANAQSTTSGNGVPASLQRENHLDKDRWDRGSSSSSSSKHEEDYEHESDNHTATSGRHKGELNGKLHMGDWS